MADSRANFGLWIVLLCAGMIGEARAITLEAGVEAFAAATGSCGSTLGPSAAAGEPSDSADGAARGLASAAEEGAGTNEPAAGTINYAGDSIDCPQGDDLFNALTVIGTTQTVSTQVSPWTTMEFGGKIREAGGVSVSVSYDANLFAPFSGASVAKAFAAGSKRFGAGDTGGLQSLGSSVDQSENALGGFRESVALYDIVPVPDLPGGYPVDTALGSDTNFGAAAKLPGIYADKSPKRKTPNKQPEVAETLSPTVFWMLVLGVPSALASVFVLFGLVGIVFNAARRRVGIG